MGFKSAHSSLFIPVCVIFVFMEVMPTMKENFLDRFYARLDTLGEKLQEEPSFSPLSSAFRHFRTPSDDIVYIC